MNIYKTLIILSIKYVDQRSTLSVHLEQTIKPIYEENVNGDKLEINREIYIHIEIGQNTQKISQKDGAISQLIILNDNVGVTFLPYPICVTQVIYFGL